MENPNNYFSLNVGVSSFLPIKKIKFKKKLTFSVEVRQIFSEQF